MNLSKKGGSPSFISRFSSHKGFTLIELLIVIAIVGILAAAVLIAINPGQRIAASRNARVRSDLANLGNNANLFSTDTGLNAGCVGGGSYPSASAQTACTATFVTIPNDPAGTQYEFAVAPAGCAPNSATPCTSIEFDGPAYADGTIVVTTNNRWCWRSTTGTVTQTTQAGCIAP